jgi:hypothetical protein
VRVTDRTKLSEATGRALFNPVQFVSALFNGRVADGFLNRFALFSVVVGGNGPHVGDRCYDIQYSPIWEDVGG